MRHLTLSLILICCVFSCSQNGNNESSQSDRVAPDEFRVYTMDLKAKKAKLLDLVDNVELLRLEETEEGLLSMIGYFNETPNHYVFYGEDKKDIFIYSSSGEFVRKINRSGQGPEEYRDVKGLWVQGDTIFVYTLVSKKVIQYDFEGHFLGSGAVQHSYGDIFPINNGYVADLSSYGFYDSVMYKLAFLDANFEKKSLAIPQNAPPAFPIRVSVNSFNTYKDLVTYKTLMSDSVFIIEDAEAKPLLKFDFGSNWLWTDPEVVANPEQSITFLEQKEKVWMVNSTMGERYIYFSYGIGLNSNSWSLLDRLSGEQVNIDLTKSTEGNFGLVPIRWVGDQLLVAFQATDVADLLNGLEETQWQLRQGTTLEEIESSENPVLMWLRFKGQ